MNDYANLDKMIVRELSCRLCLCTDVVKLKPLSAELKRKIKKLLNITVRADDHLPKAICHDCLHQVSTLHLYAVKVEKNQKFLNFHEMKNKEGNQSQNPKLENLHPVVRNLSSQNITKENNKEQQDNTEGNKIPTEHQQGDIKTKPSTDKKSPSDMKYLEAMPLEEFAKAESVDKSLLNFNTSTSNSPKNVKMKRNKNEVKEAIVFNESIDPIVIVDGKPAKQGTELDKQITQFFKMECCICHADGFNFRSLMKHYKERHGVPGYLTCCGKKFHYFYPKRIIEHMAYHLQPNIFMCSSCHQNFQTSHDLMEHQNNGGRSGGRIQCPRCSERYPTYRELGEHIVTHRTDSQQCDFCGKVLKHHHRKKTVNNMVDIVVCSHCVRALKKIEKQEKEIKEKIKETRDVTRTRKHHKFRQAMGLSADEEASTD